MDNTRLYKAKIAQRLLASPDNIFLYWKGRVALFALLKAMGVGKDDEVIVPAFTCVVVPNAILYLGAKPIYVDIEPETYNANIEQIETKISERTKVILCQNTFGLSSHVEQITTLARERHIFTIEDCTHGFGGTYHGRPNGTYCDAAFYSTQWNKPYSTGIGGFAFVKDTLLAEQLQRINEKLEQPTWKDNISLPILYFIRDKILTDRRYWFMIKIYRFLSKYKIVQGSSSGIEITKPEMPDHYFKGISKAQIKKGLKTIDNLEASIEKRKQNSWEYTRILKEMGKNHVSEEAFNDHSFLKYPLLVKEREHVMQLAEEQHIPLGEWFCSPLHPVMKGLAQWDFDSHCCPIGTQLAAEVIDLPTDIKETKKVEDFLHLIQAYIL